MSKTVRLVALLGLALAMLTACGGDDDTPLTKEEFLEQADAICLAGSEEITEATQDVDPNAISEDEFAEIIREDVIENLRQQLADVRELGFPEDDEELLDGIFDDIEAGLDELEEDPLALLEDDDPFAESNAQLQEYGFTECGQ